MKIGREFYNNINSHNSFVFPLLFSNKSRQKKLKENKKKFTTAKNNMNKMINQRASLKI